MPSLPSKASTISVQRLPSAFRSDDHLRAKSQYDVAEQDVRDAVASAIAFLPRDAKPPLIRKLDADASPILTLVVSGDRTPRELYELAERGVKDSIESVGGIGQVVINGGQKRAVNLWIDADRLAAYKIPIIQVRDAVARQNAEIPGGRVDEGSRDSCCGPSAAFRIRSSSMILS